MCVCVCVCVCDYKKKKKKKIACWKIWLLEILKILLL